MKQQTDVLGSDIAPDEGRLNWLECKNSSHKISWSGSNFTITGSLNLAQKFQSISLKVRAKITGPASISRELPWVELETSNSARVVLDLWLAGTRPLPVSNLTSICRHPGSRQYLVGATQDARLLVMDGKISANLAILAEARMDEPIISLVACGQGVLGLTAGQKLHFIEIDQVNGASWTGKQYILPVALQELAENDGFSAWGIDSNLNFFRIELPLVKSTGSGPEDAVINKAGHLKSTSWPRFRLADFADNLVKMVKAGQFCWWNPLSGHEHHGLAFDGQHFWSGLRPRKNHSYYRLQMHRLDGSLVRSFLCSQRISVSSLNYSHNQLLVLDLDHQLLHQYCVVDNLEPVAGIPGRSLHPGFQAAGSEKTREIHDLCLLYVGAESKTSVHRYDVEKLIPLVGFVNQQGEVKDTFMDGFLWLAQYSPLLNGRSFGTDLPGTPSRKEDWQALFDEYFHPQYNLQALDKCVEEVNRQLIVPIKSLGVVLGIPTPDRRCRNWNGTGLDLADDIARVKVTEWALNELFQRWHQAGFKKLHLAGFYYLTEQGTRNDPVLMSFPGLCRGLGLSSYAIPGISSAWMTEFNRAGFDAVALQSSHSFWRPFSRPRSHLLKSAGRIAREYGMGMVVELPYNVLEPDGQQKVRDYLQMAAVQGWAGAFKAYFQSFNLIKSLAESGDPGGRKIYDELHAISRCGYETDDTLLVSFNDTVDMVWQSPAIKVRGRQCFNLNVEEYEAIFCLTSLELDKN